MTETAAIWLGVSTSGQDEENQLPECEAWCAEHQYAVTEKRYVREGFSAFHESKRYDALLAAMIEDLTAGLFSVLVVWVADRIDRQDNLATIVAMVQAAGGRMEFCGATDRHLNSQMAGLAVKGMAGLLPKMAVLMRSAQAYEESALKSERVKIAHTARKARGVLGGGKIGWGYDSVCTVDGIVRCSNKQHDKIPVPSDMGRTYAKDIYVRAISGESLRKIEAWIRSETGQNISDSGIRDILTKPVYTGKYTYADGTVIECEALVTADMQEQAIKALKSRRRGVGGSAPTAALLIPMCLDCGDKAYRTGTGGTKRDYAYYCRTCHHQVQCSTLDSIVFKYVLVETINEDETELVWAEGSDSASERAEIKREMRELDPDDDDYLDKAQALRDALRALPEAVPGHFEDRPTGRSKADAIMAVKGDRSALRGLLAKWGVAFARDGSEVRVRVNGDPEIRRSLDLPDTAL